MRSLLDVALVLAAATVVLIADWWRK